MPNRGVNNKPTSIETFIAAMEATIAHTTQYKVSPDVKRAEQFAHTILQQATGRLPRRDIIWIMPTLEEARQVQNRLKAYRYKRRKAYESGKEPTLSWLHYVSFSIVQAEVKLPLNEGSVWKAAIMIKHKITADKEPKPEDLLADGRKNNGHKPDSEQMRKMQLAGAAAKRKEPNTGATGEGD